MYISNPALPIIRKDWTGNPVSDSGRFYHPAYPFELSWLDVLKWKLKPNPYADAKKEEQWDPEIIRNDNFLKHDRDVFVWLGHASFFFRLNGRNILIDPVFGKPSPVTPRYSELPVAPERFHHIDYILLTHDHRDHCDLDSLKLLAKNNPRAIFIGGLRMGEVIASSLQGQSILEMGWYQVLEDQTADLTISYLPTRHWCRRWLTDFNQRLWGAYVLKTGDKTVYFGGDSGYGDHFLETAAFFPQIDYAFLGIGAFAPKWFMKSNHMSPEDAHQAYSDLGARKLIPMHYGTFDLSDEPLGEPLRLIRKIAEENNMNGELLDVKVGEVREKQF